MQLTSLQQQRQKGHTGELKMPARVSALVGATIKLSLKLFLPFQLANDTYASLHEKW